MSEHLVRGGGDAIHRPTCHFARRPGMVHWLWPEQEGAEFWWDDGHPVRKMHSVTHRVMWLHACQRCRPDLVEITAPDAQPSSPGPTHTEQESE